MFVDIIKVCIL